MSVIFSKSKLLDKSSDWSFLLSLSILQFCYLSQIYSNNLKGEYKTMVFSIFFLSLANIMVIEFENDSNQKLMLTTTSFSCILLKSQNNPPKLLKVGHSLVEASCNIEGWAGLPLCQKNKYLKLHRKRVDSMASRYRNDENTIYIQYCRSCDTHSWCTHHDEAKYHENFLKFTEMIAHRMPEVEVIGNMVPTHLIPFKIAENKYIDANTNKYVVYPQIGSFEVTFRGRLVFSKKETHTWPNLPAIVSKVANIVNPEYQSPPKQDQQVEEDKETSKVSNNNSFLDSEEDKKTNYKPQQKGFTLTDHFKMYRPKNTFQEKDWLTEKQESEASCRQISEMGRVESRERSGDKSQKSLQTKKSSDIVGESKLKEMLKSKGMLTKQQGKKEMIIRLDSIQEENIFEEAAAATQRTQEKNIKKNRMKEIDDQINALDSKFKNFEDRVHDIQARNKQFQMKPGSSNNADDKSRFKQIIQNKRDQMERNLSVKRSRQSEIKEGKEKILLADKTNKLEQYLNYSEQEKNDKLHRIYGERKLMKQFSNKNKKLLKARDRAQQQQIDDSESQQSSKAYSHSQSPSSFANIITFKPKNEKIIKGKNLRNQKEHKYSSVERYHKVSSQLGKEIKNQTDEHFYNNNKFRKPKAEIQSDAEITNPSHHPISRLIKKGVNTLSMNALKSLANNQSNLPKIQSEATSVQNFSTTAKASINKINNRISNIQQKLKNHNSTTFQPIIESPYNADRDRNLSKKSQSRSGSQHNASMKKINRIYNNGNHQRNSNITLNSLKKNYSHDKIKNSNFSEVARPQTKKINQKPAILQETEEEFKPHQSKRKQAKYIEANEEDPVVVDSNNNRPSKSNNRFTNNIDRNSRKVSKSNEQQPRQSKQPQIRRSKQVQNSKSKQSDANKQIRDRKIQQQTLTQDQQSSARKTLKQQRSQQRLVHNQSSDPKRAFRQRKVHQQKERNINNQQPRNTQVNEQDQNGHQQRQYQHHPHQARQTKPLQRKFKDWRESSPTNNLLKSKEVNRKVSKQGINEKIRESDSKQTVIRSKKYKNGQVEQNQSIVSSNGQDIHYNASQASNTEEKKIRSGQIKKNRTKPKNSAHNDDSKVHNGSIEKGPMKRGQIRKQRQQINQLHSERTDGNEDAQYSVNNQSEEMRQDTNRFSSQIQYQTSQYQPQVNSSKVTAAHEQKLRKTLGYFKANQLCYRGVKTSEQNRSGQAKIKQDNQVSFYETQPNNEEKLCYLDEEEQREYDRQVQQEQNEEQNENEEEENSQQPENSSQSQFVPQCKKRQEAEQLEKQDPEQGWKGKSDQYENDNQMLPQEVEQSHSCRKNSLQQQLQKNDRAEARADQANEVLSVKSQNVQKQVKYSNNEVRPQTTQQVCNPSQEKVINQTTKSNNVASEGEEKQSEYQNDFENQTQMPAKVQQVPSIPDTVKKTSSAKPKVKKQAKKQSNVDVDVEMTTCKQYSQYLQYKVSNDLSKENKDDVVVNQQIVDKNEENATPLNEQSLEEKPLQNKTEPKQEAVNFMTFKAAQPAHQYNDEQIQKQQEEDYEEQVDNNQEAAEYKQELVEANNLQVSKQNVPNQQQKVAELANMNKPEQSKKEQQHKQQVPAKMQKIQQVKQVKSTPVKKEKSNLISPIPTVSNSIALPHQTTNTQQSHNIQKATPKVSSAQPSLQQQSSPSKAQTVQQSSINKQQTLQDNVYCDSKAQSSPKFMQIGVQKQLTLQVSIQTDSQLHQNDTVIIPTPFRNATPLSVEEQPKKTYRSHENRPFDNNQSEFEGTIRNNYLNQTKSSFRPERKEPLRAKITNQINSDNRMQEMLKFANIITGREQSILKEEGAVTKLSAVYTGGLMNERSLEVEHIKTKFTKFLKVIQILAERGEWILTRLFEDPKGLLQDKAFGVWLCRNFQWECFILDNYVQVDETNRPLFTDHSANQKWANVLEKAVASALGGYEQLSRAQAADIFSLLTGCNSISVRVKEDPSKNSKLLQLINDCQRKNYIVHAEKSWQRTKDQQRESIYYVLSVRRANGEDEALLEVSQDGRESFWMRLSKFTQQFSRVEILQLRVNHSFNHIDIGVGKDNQLTVVELAFQQSGQGCVTLTYVGHVGALTAYLYKEEKSKVLKLVGQAREKQKSHLFFQCNFSEGRYYVFAQTKQRPARLCYYGENSPALRITQQIHNDGLKNEVAEYLPIKENKETRPRRQMEESWNDWRGKTPRLKDNFMQSRLRENFVEYILGHNKRKDAQF